METIENQKSKKTKPAKKAQTDAVRVRKEEKKVLLSFIREANKKAFGRRIKAADVIAKSLRLLGKEHIKELQEESISPTDRFEMDFREYCKKNGNVSKNEFIAEFVYKKSDNLKSEVVTNSPSQNVS